MQTTFYFQCLKKAHSSFADTVFHIYQVMFAMRELSGPLSLLIEMVTYCSYCNEPFSLEVLQLLKVRRLWTAAVTHLVNTMSMFEKNSEYLVPTDPDGDGSTSWTKEHFSNAAGAASEWQFQWLIIF